MDLVRTQFYKLTLSLYNFRVSEGRSVETSVELRLAKLARLFVEDSALSK